MKKNFIFCLLLFLTFGSQLAGAQTTADYNTIMQRVRDDVRGRAGSTTTTNSNANVYLSDLQSNGSWADIDYGDSSPYWKTNTHLMRLQTMALAYTMPSGSLNGNAALYNGIVSALNYWDVSDPKSSNWYNNEIDCPQRLGVILILMRDGTRQLPTTLEGYLIAQMNRGNPAARTGANRTNIALHFLYRGCLLADPSVATTGTTQAFSVINTTSDEGVQYDQSFQQHGAQLYTMNYGTAFLSSTIQIATYVQGTPLAMSSANIASLSTFIRSIYLNSFRGAYGDFNGTGRLISRPGALHGQSSILMQWRDIDVANQSVYDQALDRLAQRQPASYGVGAAHFQAWTSDYTLHQRPGFMVGVRGVSTRTIKEESLNGENLKGYFMTEGATSIAVRGDEYKDIFPVWDWTKIPGTTIPALTTLPVRSGSTDAGTAAFVGGVADSQYGVSAYVMNDYGVTVKKAWFFFDNEVVCLGTGLSSTATETVTTTLNQCRAQGPVTLSAANAVSTLSTASASYTNNLQWILHDTVGYFFPNGGAVNVRRQVQNGNWHDINSAQANAPVSADVFTLYLNHGTKPTNGSYAYIIAPGKTTVAQMQQYSCCGYCKNSRQYD